MKQQQQPMITNIRKQIQEKEEEEGNVLPCEKCKKQIEVIPDEMLDGIMLNLKMKSLLRFRSLSKYCNSLISSSSFIRDHSHYSRNNLSRCSLLFQKYSTTMTIWTMLDYHSIQRLEEEEHQDERVKEEEHQDEKRVVELSSKDITIFPSFAVSYPSEFCCCCDGIICLASFCHLNVGLWNPYTNEYKTLPRVPRKEPCLSSFGIGYDSSINDYKIVNIPSYGWKPQHDLSLPAIDPKSGSLYVMTLRSNTWRKVDVALRYRSLLEKRAVSAPDGSCLYWLAKAPHRLCEVVIVAFDLAEETATQIPFPCGVSCRLNDSPLSLGLLQGCISFAWHDHCNNCFDFWMTMKEEEGVTWIKSFSFPLNLYKGPGYITSLVPQFTTKNGALVMHADIYHPTFKFRELIYHPKQGTCKQFGVAGVPDWEKFQALRVTESLVSLPSYT